MSRRAFLQQASALGAASLFGFAGDCRAEPPPETRKIRLVHAPAVCLAPQYLAEEFLRMEGFTTIEYLKNWTGWPAKSLFDGHADLTQDAAASFLTSLDAGGAAVALAGIHVGCYELFASDRIRSIGDLNGKKIAIPSLGSPDHVLMAIILAYIGIDPVNDIKWLTGPSGTDAVKLFMEGKADAYLAFAPQGYDLRKQGFTRVILNTTTDRPWSQYFCCIVLARRQFMEKYPIATKRALRAFIKATDLCDRNPERAARMLVDRGFEPRYDVALELLKELSYSRWRQANVEDTIRFHALRLREAGLIKSSPEKIIQQGTNWRFLNELKQEMKA